MAEAEDARSLCTGSYSAWMKKVKSEGAKAKWISSMTKRYFTIDFDLQLFFYSHSEDQKKVSQPIKFKEIVGAERLPPKKKLRKGSHDCGFVLRTTERNFELYTTTNTDAVQWVHALNSARDMVAKDDVAVAVSTEVQSPPGGSPKAAQSPPAGSPKASLHSEKVQLTSAPLWAIEKPSRAGSKESGAQIFAENSTGDEDVVTDAVAAGPSSALASSAPAVAATEEAPVGELQAAPQDHPAASSPKAAVVEAQPLLQERPRAPKVLPALSLRPGPTLTSGPAPEEQASEQPQQEVKLLVTRPGARRSADLESEAAPLLEKADRDTKVSSSEETPCKRSDAAVDEPQITPLSKLTGEFVSPFTDASSPTAPAASDAEPATAAREAPVGLAKLPSVGLARSVAKHAAECDLSAMSTTGGLCDLSAASLEYSVGSGSLRDSLASQKDDKGALLLPSEEDTEESSAVASTAVASTAVETAETTTAAGPTAPQSAQVDHSTARSAEVQSPAVVEQAVPTKQTVPNSIREQEAKAEEGSGAQGSSWESSIAMELAASENAAEPESKNSDDCNGQKEVKDKDESRAEKPSGWDSDEEARASAAPAQQGALAEGSAVCSEVVAPQEEECRSAREVKSEQVGEEPSGWDSEDDAAAPAQRKGDKEVSEYHSEAKTNQDDIADWDSEEETEAAVRRACGEQVDALAETVSGQPEKTHRAQEIVAQTADDNSASNTREGTEKQLQAEEPSGWDSDGENEAQPAPATVTKDSPQSPSGWDDSDEESSDDEETPLKDAACGAPAKPPEAFVSAKAKAAMGEVDQLVGMVLSAEATTPFKMGSTGSYGFVPGLQCTGCDSQVLRMENKVWNKDANYMFFRNNYPNVMKLRKHLEPRPSCCAYCCQCSSKSAEVDAVLEDVCEGLRWRMVKA